ncbi:MAG: RNA polymerase sigma factor [Solirubrobacterales bacterium]|nr:RNA polymerase sigma factor [Solirubrobacterales bacterium]
MARNSRARPQDLGDLPLKGDHEAFAAFYRRYEGVVTAYMRRRVDDSEMAADLTMEVFAAVLLAIHNERARPANLVAWLFGVARFKLLDAQRAGFAEDTARRQLSMQRIALEDSDIARIDGLTEEAKVLELLAALPTEQRDAIRARVVEDREYEAIASDAKSTETAIRQRVSRGLKSLRSEMEKTR